MYEFWFVRDGKRHFEHLYGPLTKQDVLQVSATEPVARGDVHRLVGGGFLDSLKSAFKWLLPHAGKIAHTALNGHELA